MILSWTDELIRIYDCCILNEDKSNRPVPIYHVKENAQITISITKDGEITPIGRFAEIVEDEDAATIIPVTKNSIAKSGDDTARPFVEELQFVAKDYPEYSVENTKKFNSYIEELRKWHESAFTNFAVDAVYKYFSTRSLIHDLIEYGFLKVEENDGKIKLLPEKINKVPLQKCKVRFRVDGKPTWKISGDGDDFNLQKNYSDYYNSVSNENNLCYASGQHGQLTYKHPYVMSTAKLFSYKEEGTLKYLGRFTNSEEASAMSYDVSQKIHNALSWLLDKQGVWIYAKGINLSILIWETDFNSLPNPLLACEDGKCDDISEDCTDVADDSSDEKSDIETGKIYKRLTISSLFGVRNEYTVDSDKQSKTSILMLDCPAESYKGRLSVVMYEELPTSEYLDNIINWHKQTSVGISDKASGKYKEVSFSLSEIVSCAYGRETEPKNKKERFYLELDNSKIKDNAYRRLLPCITSGARLPGDIVQTLFIKACCPLAFKDSRNWLKTLRCACAMLRKRIADEKGKDQGMSLNVSKTTRDYLYGRLLAIAEYAESSYYREKDRLINKEADDNDDNKSNVRTTNAKKYFEAFANHPCNTWRVIQLSLQPYLNRMNYKKSRFCEKMIMDITCMFNDNDFNDNSALAPEFLHAYYCQLNELYKGKNTNKNEEDK